MREITSDVNHCRTLRRSAADMASSRPEYGSSITTQSAPRPTSCPPLPIDFRLPPSLVDMASTAFEPPRKLVPGKTWRYAGDSM